MNPLTTATLLLAMVASLATGEETTDRHRGALRAPRDLDGIPGVESRIVGGSPTDIGEYDFMVNLGSCGGSLVAPDVVLTAAHCNMQRPTFARIGGSTYLTGDYHTIEGRGLLHPGYSPYSQNNDLMLYKLRTAVRGKKPVALNFDSTIPATGDTLTVIGFGTISEGGTNSFTLQEVNVNAVSHFACDLSYIGQIREDTMFCAGSSKGGKDSCQGDSGGPILDERGVQIGVVSWGNGCGERGFPGVYARISGATDWLQQSICSLSDYPPNYCGNIDVTNPSPDVPQSSPQGQTGSSFSSWLDWVSGFLFG